MKILMVCLGNICRSPLAEVVMRKKIELYHLPWMVKSAGTANYYIGKSAHIYSKQVAMRYGYSLEHHIVTQFHAMDINNYDKILAMDKKNYEDIKMTCATLWQPNKVSLLLDYVPDIYDKDVPDPYYNNSISAFEQMFHIVEQGCAASFSTFIKNS